MIRGVVFTAALATTVSGAAAAPLVRSAAGADPAAIQATVDQFRADLGGVNNGVGGGPFVSGRREINWDAAGLDAFQSPTLMPPNFFNRIPPPPGSPRGAEFSTPGTGFLVSQRVTDGTGTNLRFGDISPQYDDQFRAFSETRLFAVQGSLVMDTRFFVPSQPGVAATVNGFGVAFTDVDLAETTMIEYFDADDAHLASQFVPAFGSGLSFLGVSFDAGERIARVRLTLGNTLMGEFDGDNDGNIQDVVAMDDFIYGEPIPSPGGAALALAATALIRRRRTR